MATRKGDDDDNTLTGTAADDFIFGYGGDDVIIGGKGNDTLSGGAGSDTFVLRPGDTGRKVVTDFTGADRIDLSAIGIASFDVLERYYLGAFQFGTSFGFRTNGAVAGMHLDNINPDELKASNFILTTSTAALTLRGSAGDDDLFGANGDDTIAGGAGSDRMSGADGRDTFVFDKRQFGQDAILDFAKGDRIDLSGLGISDYDQVRYLLRINGPDANPGFTIISMLNDVEERIEVNTIGFRKPAESDFILDESTAPDRESVKQGANILFGGRGASTLTGGSWVDTLLGGAGDDVLDGGASSDILMLGDGRDRAVFSERFFGGDRILDFETGDLLDLSGVGVGDFRTIAPFLTYTNEGATLLTLAPYGGGANIYLDGVRPKELDADDFVFDTSTKARRVEGSERDDFLIGGRGDDRVAGGEGYDIVTAGAGGDTIAGGAYTDLLYGGDGADTFAYLAVSDSAPTTIGADHIADFAHAEHDRIDLSRIDADAATGRNDAFTFIGTQAFSGAAGEVRYTVSHGEAHVYVAVAPTDAEPYQMEIVLTGVTELVAADFIL